MPKKKSDAGHDYSIDGKTLTWVTEDGTVTIPMRIKVKLIRELAEVDLDAAGMFTFIDAIAPGQGEVMDEMDLNDFEDMFTTWQAEYKALSGASLGESGGSST